MSKNRNGKRKTQGRRSPPENQVPDGNGPTVRFEDLLEPVDLLEPPDDDYEYEAPVYAELLQVGPDAPPLYVAPRDEEGPVGRVTGVETTETGVERVRVYWGSSDVIQRDGTRRVEVWHYADEINPVDYEPPAEGEVR